MENDSHELTELKGGRLVSIDVFRGLNMFFIMGMVGVFTALAHCFPCPFLNEVVSQMSHVPWDGIRHHDTIFPVFLFLAGLSFPFSLTKQRAHGRGTGQIVQKILVRGLILVLLGILYNNAVSFNFATMRYASVLGHIGLAWMFAALFFMVSSQKIRMATFVLVLVGYWLLLALVPAPDTNPAEWFTPDAFLTRFQSLFHPNEQVLRGFSMEGSIVSYVDRVCLPGRLLQDIHDPEGILSLIPAIMTALLGMIVGDFVRKDSSCSPSKKVLFVILAGAALILAGYYWNRVFPINKHLWTSSFTCFVGGFAMVVFALLHFLIDIKNFHWGAVIFTVVGMNSITIYLAQQIITFEHARDFLFEGLAGLFPDPTSELILALGYVFVCWILLYFLYRKKIFLKV